MVARLPIAEPGSLSQWALIRRRFLHHRLAVASLFLLAVLYVLAAGAEFFAPYSQQWRDLSHAYCPPQLPRFSFRDGLYVPAMRVTIDPLTFRRTYLEDPTQVIALGFFVRGEPYRLWGTIPLERHFFGVRENARAPWTDPSRCSIFSAPTNMAMIFSAGLFTVPHQPFGRTGGDCGDVSAWRDHWRSVRIFGGPMDTLIQRVIEVVKAFPQIPLWLAFGAVLPIDWPPLSTYFAITLVLSLLGWTGLARVVRGKILALGRRITRRRPGSGGEPRANLFRHLLPGFTSHIIVVLTMSVPR